MSAAAHASDLRRWRALVEAGRDLEGRPGGAPVALRAAARACVPLHPPAGHDELALQQLRGLGVRFGCRRPSEASTPLDVLIAEHHAELARLLPLCAALAPGRRERADVDG